MPTYSTPIADLIARLKYHTTKAQTPKRILDGWKFEDVPTASVEGMADLPGIRIYVPDLKGGYQPTRQERGTMDVKIIIGTKRESGLVVHMQGIETVMDALNFDVTGNNNPAIIGTAKPFSWTTSENFIVDNSLNSQVSISLEAKQVELGKRRLS